MTKREVLALIARYELKGMMSLLNASFDVDIFQHIVTVYMQMYVPDRNTGQPIELRSTISFDDSIEEETFHEMFRHFLRGFWMHEFDESLQFDGQRPHEHHT